MRKLRFALLGLMSAWTTLALAQISGKVTDASTGGPLPGASVYLDGNSSGVSAGPDGRFTLNAAASGTLVVSFVGYEKAMLAAKADMGTIALEPTALGLGAASIIANVVDVAIARETPVAVSTISPSEIALKTGNQEFPEIMNRTPGVYATKQGGGYGDSRISLRGFDQTNTSFLINGQPVNDMENGRVYWSNWQGLTDVASGIQIQRGLGASRLAVPSVGGTVSIFTKAAQMEQGGSVSETIGNDGYAKTSVSYSTGKNDNGWASSFLLSKWAGDGYVYGTAGEGWTYFGAIGYEPDGSDHALNLSFLGAGQWHHQRDAWVSIRDYENFGEEGIDRRWNTDAGYMTIDGERQEFTMRRNFYNKPLATFNWDWEISDNLTLNTSVYGSAGRGGGTGPRGQYFRNGAMNNHPYNADLTEHYLEDSLGSRDADGFIDFDAVVAENIATTAGYGTTDSLTSSDFYGQLIGSNGFRDNDVNRAVEIRRASMNSHDWIGAISNLEYTTESLRASVGIDLRNYKGYHYRALNNLMGLDGYYSTGNSNSMGQVINTTIEASPFSDTGLNGPKLDYYNIGIVKWAGLNGLLEYKSGDQLTAVVQAGVSNQSYQRIDYFDQPNNPVSEAASLPGGYVKAGANYNLNESMNVFVNAGMISRQPNFDAVFPNYANNINDELENEQIQSLELGYGYNAENFNINVNLYNTTWGNRFISRSFDVAINDSTFVEGNAQFSGIDVQHRGLEIEGNYFPMEGLKLTGMLSLGDWRYTKNFDATIFDDNNNELSTATLYTEGVKVGDAAQTVANLGVDYRINSMFSLDLGARYVDGLYADYDINSSAFFSEDNPGALQLPSYSLVDLGVTSRFDFLGTNATFRVNVNNLFDTVYIAESNSNYHAAEDAAEGDLWNGIDKTNYVWFGFGRTWNASLKFNF
jgi:outer membrane cobalamin receptor